MKLVYPKGTIDTNDPKELVEAYGAPSKTTSSTSSMFRTVSSQRSGLDRLQTTKPSKASSHCNVMILASHRNPRRQSFASVAKVCFAAGR